MWRCGLCLLVLFGIVGLSPLQAQEDEPITLVIWGEPNTAGCVVDTSSTWEFCNYVRLLNERWSQTYPHILLQWENHGWAEELYANQIEAIRRGNSPDITVGESFMHQLVNQNLLAPLDLSEATRSNLIPATVAAVTKDDNLYGVAAFTAVFTLEVNADLLLLSGLNPNTTDLRSWDTVLHVARLITQAGNGDFYGFSILGSTPVPIASMFRAAPYIYQTGADFCNAPVCDTPTFDDPRSIAAYEWLQALYHYTPPGLAYSGDEGYVFSQLFTGVTAMQTAGSWHPSWAQGSGCENCRYLPLPLPPNGQPANVVVGNAMYAVLADSPHPAEAQLFLEWLVSDEMQTAVFWTGVGGRLPTTYSAMQLLADVSQGDTASVPDFYIQQMGRPIESAPAEAFLYRVFIDELLNGNVRTLPLWADHAVELNTLWNEMFREILTTERPIPEILDDYQAQAEAIVH